MIFRRFLQSKIISLKIGQLDYASVVESITIFNSGAQQKKGDRKEDEFLQSSKPEKSNTNDLEPEDSLLTLGVDQVFKPNEVKEENIIDINIGPALIFDKHSHNIDLNILNMNVDDLSDKNTLKTALTEKPKEDFEFDMPPSKPIVKKDDPFDFL